MRTVLSCVVLGLVLTLSPVLPAAAEDLVRLNAGRYQPGTIIVKTAERRLYLVLGNGRALRYSVGVGKAGKQWTGRSHIVRRVLSPAWSPPADVKRDNPRLPDYVPGGVRSNPLGAAALVLAHGEYAIHGTNRPESIGGFVSYGCIRMRNRDIVSLYNRVKTGAPVVVLP